MSKCQHFEGFVVWTFGLEGTMGPVIKIRAQGSGLGDQAWYLTAAGFMVPSQRVLGTVMGSTSPNQNTNS